MKSFLTIFHPFVPWNVIVSCWKRHINK